MKIIVKGRRPVGRPSNTSVENVEADVAELEIDREDIHYCTGKYEKGMLLFSL